MSQPDNSWMLLTRHQKDGAYFDAFHLESKTSIDPATSLLKVAFRLTGPVSELLWPKEEVANDELIRDQELWKHTCFEIFLGSGLNDSYFEWNLSPARKWGHFRFKSYRISEEEVLPKGEVIKIDFKREVNSALLTAEIQFAQIPTLMQALKKQIPLLLSTTAILESKKGEKSHWALSHQDATPDFHRSSSFISKIL